MRVGKIISDLVTVYGPQNLVGECCLCLDIKRLLVGDKLFNEELPIVGNLNFSNSVWVNHKVVESSKCSSKFLKICLSALLFVNMHNRRSNNI